MNYICDLAKSMNTMDHNKFFVKLPYLSLNDFIQTHSKFGQAVNTWSIVLALLLAKVPSYHERRVILKNLNDENNNPSHVETFHEFLNLLKTMTNIVPVEDSKYNDAITKFIMNMRQIVDQNNWIYASAAYGMIEYAYITVSHHIHNYITKFNPSQDLPHYSKHELIDVDHAHDLFEIIAPHYSTNQRDIVYGLNRGFEVLYELYEDLSN